MIVIGVVVHGQCRLFVGVFGGEYLKFSSNEVALETAQFCGGE